MTKLLQILKVTCLKMSEMQFELWLIVHTTRNPMNLKYFLFCIVKNVFEILKLWVKCSDWSEKPGFFTCKKSGFK